MSLRFFEIVEANHLIQNPFDHHKLMLLGEICSLHPGMRQLDLACGKGEMLCQWAQKWGITGVGVDISAVFLEEARARSREMDVAAQLSWVESDATHYPQDFHQYDIVSCLGATWIGGGLVGTINMMKPALKRGGMLLVGEPYWNDNPPPEAYSQWAVVPEEFASLEGTLSRIEEQGFELVEMILADTNNWDRYLAMQWMAASRWLDEHPRDVDAPALREWIANEKRIYLKYGRRYFGWGVFVLRAATAQPNEHE